MRALLAILIVVVLLLQAKMWFGEGGYRDVQRLAADRAASRPLAGRCALNRRSAIRGYA